MNIEEMIRNLDPELQEKVRKCAGFDEIRNLAEEEKIPLPAETLEAVAGGTDAGGKNCGKVKCPSCGSSKTKVMSVTNRELGWVYHYKCTSCGYEWDKFYYYEH